MNKNETYGYICWKWTKGTNYEKTLRGEKHKEQQDKIGFQGFEPNIQPRGMDFCKDEFEPVTHKNGDNYPEFQEPQYINDVPRGFIQKEKKLNGQNEKLSSRHMMIQKNINPFLERNYLQDLNTEDEFLRPRNSNT